MRNKFVLFVTFIFFLFLIPLSAQKKNSDSDFELVDDVEEDGDVMSLMRISSLINKRQLAEATKQLSIYIEAKPDNFDNAQLLLNRIFRLRMQYAELAEAAIRSNNENPDDDETPAKLIQRMNRIEPNPPKEIAQIIRQLEILHLFKYYQKTYNDVLTKSAAHNNNLDPVKAMEDLKEGFSVFRDELEKEENGFSIYYAESADAITELLNERITLMEENLKTEGLKTAVEKFNDLIQTGNLDQAIIAYSELEAEFKKFDYNRQALADCGYAYKELADELKAEHSEVTDANHISMMQHYVTGDSSIENSGMIPALNTYLCKYMDSVKNTLTAAIVSQKDSYAAFWPKEILKAGENFTVHNVEANYAIVFDKLVTLSDQTTRLYDSAKELTAEVYEDNSVMRLTNQYIAGLVRQSLVLIPMAFDLSQTLASQKIYLSRLDNDISGSAVPAAGTIDSIFKNMVAEGRIVGLREALVPENFEWSKNYKDIENTNTKSYVDWSLVTGNYVLTVGEIFTAYNNSLIEGWDKIAEAYCASADKNVIAVQSDYGLLERFQKGIGESISSAEITAFEKADGTKTLVAYLKENLPPYGTQLEKPYRYPSLLRQLSDSIQNEVSRQILLLQSQQKVLADNFENNPSWKEVENLPILVESADAHLLKNIAQLNNLTSAVASISKEADAMILSSKVAKAKADSLFEDARVAVEREEFERAESLLEQAREKYSESLGFAEDANLREVNYTQRADLEDNIYKGRNRVVVRNVRSILDEAQSQYNLEEYDRALEVVSSAERVWKTLHTEEDDKNLEIEDFKALVELARDATEGRELSPDDQLYSVISQNLSFATQYFESAEEYKKIGDSEQYDSDLKQSEKLVGDVKRIYPRNQAASILQLKINRLKDPVTFRKEFDEKIRVAKNKVDTGNRDAKNEGYNDLLAYQKLEPNYKDLNSIVYDAGITMGVIARPVTNRELIKSIGYLQEAERLYKIAKNDADYDKVIELADKAISSLNRRTNQKEIARAQEVKDNSLLKKTPIIPTFTPEDELLFESIQTNINTQLEIAERDMRILLGRNKNYIRKPEVKKLKDQLESRLGRKIN